MFVSMFNYQNPMLQLLLRAGLPQSSTVSRPDNNNNQTLSSIG